MSFLSNSVAPLRAYTATTPEAFVQLETYAGRDLGERSLAGGLRREMDERSASNASLPQDGSAALSLSAVIAFWRAAGPSRWFVKEAEFDRHFREGFLTFHEFAAQGQLASWAGTEYGALALVLLLDQFPRNAFRGTPRMYATDATARKVADAAIAAGYDQTVDEALRLFLYLPFGHSERLVDQDRSVALAESLGQPSLSHAERHRDIIRRFGRFPHRNPILGRAMTPEEQRFLENGGFAG
jgi:uncharacterized protein (DUF924 family)